MHKAGNNITMQEQRVLTICLGGRFGFKSGFSELRYLAETELATENTNECHRPQR